MTCDNCIWYYEPFGTCCNGDSPYCADILNENDTCEYFEEKDKENNDRKI